ncbi:MAG TPA: hypothetical protein VL361_25855 [Candidatus Limnocylindrales bacterium]|nr:hypothetical protein [Candidatus Limnocylindrales bacterium]
MNLNVIKVAFAAALAFSPAIVHSQTAASLRSYAISGTENSRYFDAIQGWIVSTQTFSGTFDLTTLTDARLTKVYPDGTTVVKDLILQWVVDLNAPTQGGMAVEVPDPNDPIIKRTTYNLSLQSDGIRYTASGNFTTRAWMSVIPGIYDWFNVAYGDFSGLVVSPLGDYFINGTEKAGKTISIYTGILTLTSPTTGRLTKVYPGNVTNTVNLMLQSALDLTAATQTVVATQVEHQPNQSTIYSCDLQLNGIHYSVSGTYFTTQMKGNTSRTISTGNFAGLQP